MIPLIILLILTQAVTLFVFGQPPICTCGYVKLWESAVLSSGNSQHLTDWYSFSHVIHGFIFYALLLWLAPQLTVMQRLGVATGVEAAWEITENSSWLINHYRQQALSQGYVGDSILNSVSDTVMMLIGFVVASRAPVAAVVALAVGFELFTGYFIRDGLLLNVLGLFWRPDFIAHWQMQAHL